MWQLPGTPGNGASRPSAVVQDRQLSSELKATSATLGQNAIERIAKFRSGPSRGWCSTSEYLAIRLLAVPMRVISLVLPAAMAE